MSNYFDIFDIVLSLIKLSKFYSLLVSQSMNWKNLGTFVDFSYLLFLILGVFDNFKFIFFMQ